MKEQVVGYILVGLGICIMWYTVMQVYMLFAGQTKPFTVSHTTVRTQERTPDTSLENPADLQTQMTNIVNQLMERQMQRIIDLSATVFFYYFLMLLGFRLSSLGVQFVRPIKVTLRAKSDEVGMPPQEKK